MLSDLANLSADHTALGNEAALIARYHSLQAADQHLVAAYERFAERLVNALDQITRDLAVLEGGDATDIGNLGGPAALRLAGRLSGVKGADAKLEEAASLRVDLQHHYGALRAAKLYSVVDGLCRVLPEVMRGLRPRLLKARVKIP